MFTHLFPSADFGDKERRLIFNEGQNAPEQDYAKSVEASLTKFEENLDSPLRAEGVAEIKVAIAEKDANAMKQGIESALGKIAGTEFALLKDKYKGDEDKAFTELQSDFRKLGNGLVNIYGKNPDGTFAIQVIVPGAQNRLPSQGGPDPTPSAPAAAPNAPASAPKEMPADVPAEKIKDLPQDAQDWIQEVYKNLPPYQKGVLLDYISAQEGRAVVVGLGEKTGKFNPEIVRALAALNGDALKDPSKIKDRGLQDLVKSLTPAERTLLSKLMNFKETPEKGKLTEEQKNQIVSDGQGIMREYQKILAENPNPTKQQQEQFLAKLQMKGCDVTNEKALLAGDASAIKALDGAGWERTMNQVMGLFRYLGTAITAVKEKLGGKKQEAGTEGKTDQPAETPEDKSWNKGKAILKNAGETAVGTLFSFNKDKGILPKVGDQENFPVFQFENGAWQMKLNAGGPDWTNAESAKLPDMPTTLTEEQKQTYKRWEKARVELGKLNEETAKAITEAKPSPDAQKPKEGEGKKPEGSEETKEKPSRGAKIIADEYAALTVKEEELGTEQGDLEAMGVEALMKADKMGRYEEIKHDIAVNLEKQGELRKELQAKLPKEFPKTFEDLRGYRSILQGDFKSPKKDVNDRRDIAEKLQMVDAVLVLMKKESGNDRAVQRFNKEFSNTDFTMELRIESVEPSKTTLVIRPSKEGNKFSEEVAKTLQEKGFTMNGDAMAAISNPDAASLEAARDVLSVTGFETMDVARKANGKWAEDPKDPKFDVIMIDGKYISQSKDGKTCYTANPNDDFTKINWILENGKYFDKNENKLKDIPIAGGKYNSVDRAWEVNKADVVKEMGDAELNNLDGLKVEPYGKDKIVGLSWTGNDLVIGFHDGQWEWKPQHGDLPWAKPDDLSHLAKAKWNGGAEEEVRYVLKQLDGANNAQA